MRHFVVRYYFRHGINGRWEDREIVITFDDDHETTDADFKSMAEREVNIRFERSDDYPLYGKFWEVYQVEEVDY